MSAKKFLRPGVIVSIFVPTPFDHNAIYVLESTDPSEQRADLEGAVLSLWKATDCTKPDPKFKEAADGNRIAQEPANKISNIEELKEILEQTKKSGSLMAAAIGDRFKTHQAILQRQSDAISLRCNFCAEKVDDDLSTVADWGGGLIKKAEQLPVFGMTRIYYFEFSETEDGKRQVEFDMFAESIRTTLGLVKHRSNKIVSQDGSIIQSRIESPRDVGTLPGLENTFVVGITKGEQNIDKFIANFFLADNYRQIPPGVLYSLAFKKIWVHRHKAVNANIAARANCKLMFDQLNVAAGLLKNGQRSYIHGDLASIAEKLQELDKQLLLVRESQTTINLNIELVSDRAAKAFGIDIFCVREKSPPAFIGEDFTQARGAQLEVSGFVEYLQLISGQLNNQINFIRTQLEAFQLEFHERLTERFHLLEVFIVTVYVLELPHIYEQLKGMGLVLAAISATIVLCFIFGLPKLSIARHQVANGYRHQSGQGWSLRTVVACTALIFLPYLWSIDSFKNVWSSPSTSPAGIKSKPLESAPESKVHSN
jgi:hypothetical protein